MHVLITRPEPDAAILRSRIEGLGCTVSVAPLLNIVLNEITAGTFDDASALVATSRNGLKSLSRSPALAAARELPVFVVGPATAALAEELGFKTIIAGPGTAAELVKPVVSHAASRSGTLVHLVGDHQAFDLATALTGHGVNFRTVSAYHSVAAETLPDDVVEMLKKRLLDAVVLMSPRTAKIWARLLLEMPFALELRNLEHVCLSRAVAENLQPLPAAKAQIADQPNADEIVALVYRLAVARKTG